MKKTETNPKGAGRNKFEDPEMVKDWIKPFVTKKAIRLFGGKKNAEIEAAKHIEKAAKNLEKQK